VIAFNGEIYNHLEIRRELETRGRRFQSHADTETVLEAFLEWDLECFQKLRGMFAVAFWSESRKRLVLARDRLGIKPLYVARRGADVLFGSELKTILIHPEFERRLDPASLDCYLAMNYAPAPFTMLEGVEKLEPGTWLEWRAGEVRKGTWWRLPLSEPKARKPGEAEEELDVLLRESVREHLLSDVPLGVWLSGGLDSSTVVHYASAALDVPLRTYSISFAGRTFDESNYIREVASRYGTRHEQLDLNPGENLAGAIESFADYADEPNADAGALPVWFLSRMTRQSSTVSLSGEGADEIFGGYLTYQADALSRHARRFPRALRHAAANLLRRLPVSDEKIGLEYMLKRFAEGSLMDSARAHVYWNGAFSDEEKSKVVTQTLPAALKRLLDPLKYLGGDTGSYLWFDQKYYLADDILAKVDRMSMAHSLEVRPPFLDHRIVEFAATLPASLKTDGGRRKIVLKSLMRDKLPQSVLRRGKQGLDIPAHEWLRGPLRPLLLEALEWGVTEHGEFFRKTRIHQLVESHLSRRTNAGYQLWGLMILFLWMRRWRVQSTTLCEPGLRQAESSLSVS
jgi:asparagine synthase (glutamine-hydrolysing)